MLEMNVMPIIFGALEAVSMELDKWPEKIGAIVKTGPV